MVGREVGAEAARVFTRPVSPRDYTFPLWLLKLGALLNLYFMVEAPLISGGADPFVVVPAQIFFAVSLYRCLFPVHYDGNFVLHNTVFSSTFITRLCATFSEIALIFLFSHLLRRFNSGHIGWVTLFSWLMVVQVVISQCFVWAAIITVNRELYWYEEFGWLLIFTANAIASDYLYLTVGGGLGSQKVLLILNTIFGILYLPFEVLHLASIRSEILRNRAMNASDAPAKSTSLLAGLKRSMQEKNRSTDRDAWGGIVGLMWITGYTATLIPMWVYYIVCVVSR